MSLVNIDSIPPDSMPTQSRIAWNLSLFLIAGVKWWTSLITTTALHHLCRESRRSRFSKFERYSISSSGARLDWRPERRGPCALSARPGPFLCNQSWGTFLYIGPSWCRSANRPPNRAFDWQCWATDCCRPDHQIYKYSKKMIICDWWWWWWWFLSAYD